MAANASTRIVIEANAYEELMATVPHWNALLLGPVPFGQSHRFQLAINGIRRATREEAEECVWDWAKKTCVQFDHIYNEDEWTILHLACRNCS